MGLVDSSVRIHQAHFYFVKKLLRDKKLPKVWKQTKSEKKIKKIGRFQAKKRPLQASSNALI